MRSSALVTHSSVYVCWPEYGMGHHTAPPMDYGADYFREYRDRDASSMGAALTRERVAFVKRNYSGPLVDVGIGGGRFVEEYGGDGFGYDINPDAVEWLHEQKRFCDPYATVARAVTCWDSLEHLQKPHELVGRVFSWVFVSMPVYHDIARVHESKHYKPGEHLWYWTDAGLIAWFDRQGFDLAEKADFETQLGREGIYSYAFKRRRAAQ